MEIEKSVRGLLDPLWEDGLKYKIPLYLQYEITSQCNLMCRMCYIASSCGENKKRELTASQWLEISRQARDMGLILVNITGGEPIMKDDFWQLHEGLTNLGVIYTLNTNGTTMTKETVKRLAQSPPFRALVSIYGGSEDTYAKVTTSGKWFEKAKAGVENLLEAGIPTVIRMTVIKDNIDDISKVFKWTDSIGQDLFYSDYMSPRREGNNTDPVEARLDPEQMIQVKRTMFDLYRQKEEELKKSNPKSDETPLPQKEKSDDVQSEKKAEEPKKPYRFMREEGFGCGSGQVSAFISYDGNLMPCSKTNDIGIKLTETTFADAWKNVGCLCKKVPSCTDCESCEVAEYCVPCPPKLMAESGSYSKKSAYLCEYAHKLREYITKIKTER